MSRFKGLPVGGLPAPLPAGEALLWQGRPDWWALAKYAFRVRIVGVYFLALILWRVTASADDGLPLLAAFGTAVHGVILGLASVSMFLVLSWLIARSTTYSITSKRVIITYGMALPKSVNLPFTRLEAADVKVNAEGTGDIVMKLPAKVRLSYLLLWPHVHGGKNGRAEPVLRGIADPAQVADLLAEAIVPSLGSTARAVAAPARAAAAAAAMQGQPA